MRFDQGTIKEVLAKSDIAAIIGEHVALRKRGNDLVGLCPFHGEKTPSFHVHPDRGFFKCFGCGAGGDVIAFVQKLENVTFPEAVQTLARRAGVELEAENPAAARVRSEREAIYEANALAAAFFHRMLTDSPKGAEARAYCERRSLSASTIETFKIGYAPDSWDALAEELRRAGVDHALAARAGLLKAGQRGYYDFYRHRLMIPTMSTTGETIAFGGRALGDEEPKYLNTSSTPVYTKGRHLYALNLARRAVASAGAFIVVEGYLDCIALHQAGYANAVASLGTSFTAEQAAELRKYAENVLLCFDADTAGRAATVKAIDTLAAAGLAAKVIAMPPGEDPDSYMRNHGAPAFAALVAGATEAVLFKLDLALDGMEQAFASREALARRAAAIVRDLAPRGERQRWVTYVAGRLELDATEVREALSIDQASVSRAHEAQVPRPGRHLPSSVRAPSVDQDVVTIFLEDPFLLTEYGPLIPPERFKEPLYRRLYVRMLGSAGTLTGPVQAFALFADDDEAKAVVANLQGSDRSSLVQFPDTEARRAHLDRIVRRLEREDQQQRLREVDARIEQLLSSGMPIPSDLRSEYNNLTSILKK